MPLSRPLHLPSPVLAACLLVLLPALLTAQQALSSPVPEAEWTLMYYICADNNIEEDALLDLAEMEQALPEGVEVVFLIDRSRGFSRIFGDWTGTRLYRMRRAQPFDMRGAASHRRGSPLPKDLASELIADWGEADMANPATLARFIAEAAGRFPAKRYALVPWNHGGTWTSLLLDEDGGSGKPGKGGMNIQNFAAAARQGARSLPRGRFDLVLYDMCLMGQLDVMAETASLADYAFACAPVEPTQSLDYLSTLPLFGQGLATEEILRRMVELNVKYYRALPEEASFTACRLDRLPEVLERLRGLSAGLAGLAGKRFKEFTRAACYASRQGGDLMDEIFKRKRQGLFAIEIYDWLDLLENEVPDAPKEAIRALRQALEGFVLKTDASPDARLSRGLTLYHPLRRAFLRPEYARTDFARASGLAAYFDALFKAQETLGGAKPKVSNIAVGMPRLKPGRDGSGGDADFDIEPVAQLTPFTQTSVKFDVTGSGILMTRLLQYEKHGKDFVLHSSQIVTDQQRRSHPKAGGVLSRVSPVYPDGTTTLMREMGGVYKLSNGRETVTATVENISVSSGIHDNVSSIRGLYSSPDTGGREILVNLIFSNHLRTLIKTIAFQTDASGRTVASQIHLKSTGTLRPCIEVLDSSKNFAARLVYGKPLSLATGTLFITVDMLEEGIEAGNFIIATTMNGQNGVGLSPALRVHRSPEQVAMAERARKEGGQALAGRFAMIQYATTAEGVKVLPTFQTLEIIPQRPLARFVFRDRDRETGSGLVDWRPYGIPQLSLFKRPTKMNTPLGEHVQTWYAFLDGQGPGRVWWFIGMGDGDRWAMVPVEQYQDGFLEGVWIGEHQRWEFRGQTVRLTYNGQQGEGTFSLKENVLSCTGMPSPQYAIYFDRRQNTLYMMSSDKRHAVLRREGAAGPQVQPQHEPKPNPQPRRVPTAAELAGGWHAADPMVPAKLDIVPVTGTPYLNIYYAYRGQPIWACTAAISGGELLATFSDASQERIRYAFAGRALVLASRRLHVQSFIRD